jgi:hypothetical protein
MDEAYYYVNALNLAGGRGFVEDFVWNYLGDPGPPPQPSHLYWMPLTSIVAWLGMAFAKPSYDAAQIPFVLLSALLAPTAYAIATSMLGRPWHGWLAGLFVIFSGFYFPFWTAIDNFTPFALFGTLALFAGGSRWFVVAGLGAGLAHLARADGPLILIAVIFSYFPMYRLRQFALEHLFPLFLGYLLITAPWFVRNWYVTGTFLPVAGSQTIWLRDYNELYSYGREFSAQTLFAQGIGPVVAGRWWALGVNLQTVVAVWGMIFLTPLAVIGGWHLRGHRLIRLVGLYALLLFLAMSLVFPFPGARGGLFHSGAALFPFICATAAIGFDQTVTWIAARRRQWDAATAKKFLGMGLLLLSIALSGHIYYQRIVTWNNADPLLTALAGWMAQEHPTAMVMVSNPPAYRYYGGGLSTALPYNDLETTLQAAARYRVDYLVIDQSRSDLTDPLAPLYSSTFTHPNLSLIKTFTAPTGGAMYVFKVITDAHR